MGVARTSIVVVACTYRRNGPLACLLEALTRCAARVRDRAAVGVVIVDDTAAGEARSTAERFADWFELGLHYRISGKQNISLARNLAIETALPLGDWIAMTDDDCEPVDDWLALLLDVQEATDADAVTGIMLRRAPADAPAWLRDQPFFTQGHEQHANRGEMPTAFTNNVLMRAAWLRDHGHRFEPELGVIGGEDMVFFRSARAQGMRIRFAARAHVVENEPSHRLTFRYQLWRFCWYGNSSYVTSVASGTSRARMAVHGAAVAARAVARPLVRAIRLRPPQLRYAAALLMQAAGIEAGVLGLRVDHH